MPNPMTITMSEAINRVVAKLVEPTPVDEVVKQDGPACQVL